MPGALKCQVLKQGRVCLPEVNSPDLGSLPRWARDGVSGDRTWSILEALSLQRGADTKRTIVWCHVVNVPAVSGAWERGERAADVVLGGQARAGSSLSRTGP